jgi:hypothetical protein
MLELTRRLLRLREERPSLRLGSYAGLDDLPPGCFGFIREHDGDRTLVLASFSDDELAVALPSGNEWNVIISSTASGGRSERVAGNRVQLAAHEVVILGRAD